jgi:hypothetical protein
MTAEAQREYYCRLHDELLTLASARLECEREIGEVPIPVCPVCTS